MSKIKSFKEFEKRLKDQTILTDQNNNELIYQIIGRKKAPLFLRASLITLFLTVFITTSIATAMQFSGWKFTNSEGKEVLEIRTMSEEENEPNRKYSEIHDKFDSVQENLKKDLPKGEFIYFLPVEAYEEIGGRAGLSMFMNGEKIESVTQIPNELKELLSLKKDLPNGYEFLDGLIHYKIPNLNDDATEVLVEEMYREAKENNVPYSVKKGKLTSEISSVQLNYGKENDAGVSLTISPEIQWLLTNEDLSGYTQVTEGEVEYLYSEESGTVHLIKEVNSRKLLVTIYGEIGDTPEKRGKIIEGLLDIARSL